MSNMEEEGRALGAFFRRLAEDTKLYNDYLDDPLEVMRAAGLDEETISLVLQRDLRGINRLIAKGYGDSPVICGTIVVG